MRAHSVGVWRQPAAGYPSHPPFDPPETFPETPVRKGAVDPSNGVYGSVRSLLHLMGLDAARFGQPNWNPLGSVVRPGDTVFVKPNLIAEKHALTGEWLHVTTHGSVLRAVLDYVFVALQGRGKIKVGDAPQTDSNIAVIRQNLGIDSILKAYEDGGVSVEFLDLRDEYWPMRDGIVGEVVKLSGDPLGTALVDLGSDSYFAEVDHKEQRYYGAYYDIGETNSHHRGGKHEYKIARSPLAADVFISVPKLKTHKKVGVTMNLKGLVGINGDKNYLPHYAIGSPEENGDQFPAKRSKSRLENVIVTRGKNLIARGNPVAIAMARVMKPVLYRIFGSGESTVRAGNWWGNDTCWRMSLDLNRILTYANADGRMGSQRKRYFSVVDGIVAMEGNGPVGGTSRAAGVLIAGDNPAAVDAAGTYVMGFDCAKVQLVERAFDAHRLSLASGSAADVVVQSNEPAWSGRLGGLPGALTLRFTPHFAWRGHVELDAQSVTPSRLG